MVQITMIMFAVIKIIHVSVLRYVIREVTTTRLAGLLQLYQFASENNIQAVHV
jgi:hypothetical protein